jgi:hypothetical protein
VKLPRTTIHIFLIISSLPWYVNFNVIDILLLCTNDTEFGSWTVVTGSRDLRAQDIEVFEIPDWITLQLNPSHLYFKTVF